MALNFKESGERLDWTATANVVSGQIIAIGDMVGVVLGDALIGEKVVVCFKGVFALPKVAPQVQAIGVKVYFDATAGNITTTSSGNKFIGYVWAAAISAATTVDVVLAQ